MTRQPTTPTETPPLSLTSGNAALKHGKTTASKAPGRVEDVPAPCTSLRCSVCGWIDKNSRKSQAEFVCSFCGFTCNADTNAAINVAAGQGGIPRPRRTAGAGGTTPPEQRSSVREPQPTWVGIPLF
ncbi:zinc ribbon domain-containing protein [Streptomyces sp. NBC_00151]|uniref:zinc ribbon domain-containing protein n=1 Tax=Streptomyces sp. NBC_00151 TaxID=2975669 RepID=UPI002DDBC45E|nr:zinc ribbon domain-containing protein [Streptomyces sp. NBC_00151]WRZ36856.1 transposase [Streptomyces sp. NBC_00151]WRZ44722.1 transposase [Streptomyces sp. NBC_00151]